MFSVQLDLLRYFSYEIHFKSCVIRPFQTLLSFLLRMCYFYFLFRFLDYFQGLEARGGATLMVFQWPLPGSIVIQLNAAGIELEIYYLSIEYELGQTK